MASEPTAPDAGAAPDEAKQAGRGVIYIAFAKIYFIFASAIIEFGLPRLLTAPVFGAYGVVAATVSPLNNVLITGTIQAVSRFTAQRPHAARAIQAAGFRMHLLVGLPVALVFAAMAPAFAYFYHDSTKTLPLALAACIVAGYSFYAVFVGTANGRRQFHVQAGLDMTFATLRAIGILGLAGGLAASGLGVFGAIGGWVAAVGLILVVATFAVGLPRREARERAGERAPRQTIRPMAGYLTSVGIYLVLLNLLMVVDTQLLKRLTGEWFQAHAARLPELLPKLLPQVADTAAQLTPAEAADGQVGYYRAVQNLARLSYQAIIAATFVVFPLVSRSTFESDESATHRYIRTTMRYSLIFAAAIAVVMAANPEQLLDIPYTAEYAYFGAPALIALALGNVAFSLFAIVGTILNGAGLTRQAIAIAAVTLVVAVVANYLVIPRFDPGRDVLLAAATATGGSMAFGAVIGGWLLRKHLGAFVPALTVVRVVVAGAAAIGLGRVIPVHGALMTLVEAAVIGLAFFAVLIATRELTRTDLQAVLAVARRRRGAR